MRFLKKDKGNKAKMESNTRNPLMLIETHLAIIKWYNLTLAVAPASKMLMMWVRVKQVDRFPKCQ